MPHSDQSILRRLAADTGMDTRQILKLLSHAVARHVRTHGTLPIPIHIGLPNPRCHLCAYAQTRGLDSPDNLIDATESFQPL